jgi:hypothetical protein
VDPRYAKNLAATDALADDDDRRDPYSVSKDKKTPAYGLDGSRHDATHARDREIENPGAADAAGAEGVGAARRGERGAVRVGARSRADAKRFDYAALDIALELLRQHDPVAYRALHAVWVYGWLREAGGAADEACRRGLAFLSPRLAVFEFARGRNLRAPGVEPVKRVVGPMRAEAGDVAKRFRDEQMRNRAAAGATPADIAKEFRVSIRTVYRAVNEAA